MNNRFIKGFVDVFAHPMTNIVWVALGGFNLGASLTRHETYWSLWNIIFLALTLWIAWKDCQR